ncbi:MAG TPA: HIT family protein [Sphingomicrobium sp.]|jgi:diadenosine tetraphosphate (Ap4A) HIT family hydrolase|nr:HIT family protein [Sphingomicrobium sp.]
MNPTIEKFGYPTTLIREYEHWLVLLRPEQVTLGSLVLAAKSDARAWGDLPSEAFAEQSEVIAAIERNLRDFVQYEKINYLMLMMVDPNVHFHVIPRYSQFRRWNGVDFPDSGWPGQPQLASAIHLSRAQLKALSEERRTNFR